MAEGPPKKKVPTREGTISATPESPLMAEINKLYPGLYDEIRAGLRAAKGQANIFSRGPVGQALNALGMNPSQLLTEKGLFEAAIGPIGKSGAFMSEMAETYGKRLVPVETPSKLKAYIAAWSNSANEWWISRMPAPKKGMHADLDANEVLVYAKNLTHANQALYEMPPLGLGQNSFEARARRGVFGAEEQKRQFRTVEGSKQPGPEGTIFNRPNLKVEKGGASSTPVEKAREWQIVDYRELPDMPSLTGGPIFLESGEINEIENAAYNRLWRGLDRQLKSGKPLATVLEQPMFQRLVPKYVPNLLAWINTTDFGRGVTPKMITQAKEELIRLAKRAEGK